MNNEIIETILEKDDNREIFTPSFETLPTWLRPSFWQDIDRQRFYKLLQIDVLAAWEYDQEQTHHELSGEQELWFAVLATAMEDFKSAWIKRNQNRKRLDDLYDYFFGFNDGAGSFSYCCDQINANKANCMRLLIKFAKEHSKPDALQTLKDII